MFKLEYENEREKITVKSKIETEYYSALMEEVKKKEDGTKLLQPWGCGSKIHRGQNEQRKGKAELLLNIWLNLETAPMRNDSF